MHVCLFLFCFFTRSQNKINSLLQTFKILYLLSIIKFPDYCSTFFCCFHSSFLLKTEPVSFFLLPFVRSVRCFHFFSVSLLNVKIILYSQKETFYDKNLSLSQLVSYFGGFPKNTRFRSFNKGFDLQQYGMKDVAQYVWITLPQH